MAVHEIVQYWNKIFLESQIITHSETADYSICRILALNNTQGSMKYRKEASQN